MCHGVCASDVMSRNVKTASRKQAEIFARYHGRFVSYGGFIGYVNMYHSLPLKLPGLGFPKAL